MKLENLDLTHLGLFSSQNISIEDSKIFSLTLNQCSGMQITNTSKVDFLYLIGSEKNLIENCTIGTFKSIDSIHNQIKGCTIDKIKRYKRSRNNLIIDCLIPPNEQIKLEKKQKKRLSFYTHYFE